MTGDLDAAATPHGDGPVADGPAADGVQADGVRADGVRADAGPATSAPAADSPADGVRADAGPATSAPAADSPADASPDSSPDETAGTSATDRAGTPDGKKPGRRGGALRELVVLVVLVLGFTFLLRAFVFEAYLIPSGSMENTLRVSDKVLVDKLSYRFGSIRRGDVIVFNGAGSFTPATTLPPSGPVQRVRDGFAEFFGGTPAGEEDFTKRVIGLPGDRVECRAAGGGHAMFVNGVRLQERSYLFPGDEPCTRTFTGADAVVVPPGRLWVMGDHRSLSADSREHVDDGHLGTVPEDEVIGKAFAIAWPAAHWTGLSRPATFDRPALRHG